MSLSLKTRRSPILLTQPVIFPGFPITNANAGTSLVTTDPEPIRAYSPMVMPQIMVAFAPIEADFFTSVFS